jgi:opacity protein-like surface antigen
MKKWIFSLLHVLAVHQGYALDFSNTKKILSLSAGPAWYNAGQTQTLYLQSNFLNTYSATRTTQALFNGEVFLGAQTYLHQKGIGELGITLNATNSAQLQGQVWETGDSNFDNYSYQYRIKHQHIGIKAKWLFSEWSHFFYPYLSTSVGIARNTSYHFHQTPLIYEALPIPGFQNQTITACAYTFGGGLARQLHPNWRVSLGYQFMAWGKSELGRTPTQTVNTGLTLSNLYTQQLELTISYLL